MTHSQNALPEILKPLFWDVDIAALDWETDHDWIVRRILSSGNWQSVCWLRSTWGDRNLATWLINHAGGHLNSRQLRYWQLILGLPAEEVDLWIIQARNSLWERRRTG